MSVVSSIFHTKSKSVYGVGGRVSGNLGPLELVDGPGGGLEAPFILNRKVIIEAWII